MPSTLAGRKESNQIHVRSQHRGAFDAGLRSFINEARLLAKFSHPALVHVYRFFEANGTAYMVMQYYEGQTFRAFLNQQPKAMDEQWLSAIIAPILDVLEMLHAADCYHRDIAPDNIFLQSSGMPVLLDFGAARRIIGDMTQALTMVLKPGFAPIEQYVDDGAMPQGAWTDIYQLGALLYLSITGRPPATSVARMINDPVSTLVPENCPGFSARFLSGVHHALAIKPQDRPQSIGELRHLLGLKTVTLSWPSSGMMGLGAAESSFSPSLDFDAPAVVSIPAAAPAPSPAEAVPTPLIPQLEAGRITAQPQALQPIPIPPAHQQERIPSEARASRDVQSVIPPPLTPSVPRPDIRARKVKTAQVKGEAVAQRSPSKRAVWLLPALGFAAFVLIAGGGAWWFTIGNEGAKQEVVLPNSQELDQWGLASRINTPDSLRTYLSLFPSGTHRAEAEERLAGLMSPALPASVPLAPQAPASAPLVVASAAPAAVTDVAAAKLPVPPAPAASTPALPAVMPPPEDPARTLAQAARAADAENKGKIILRVMPWGNVSVDRVPAGTTPPLTQLTLTEGLHRIDISNPVAPTVTKMVLVKKGESFVLTHKFE